MSDETTAQDTAPQPESPPPAETESTVETWSDGSEYQYSFDPEKNELEITAAPEGAFTGIVDPNSDEGEAILATKPPSPKDEDQEEVGDCPEDTYDQCWLVRNMDFFESQRPDGARLGDKIHMLAGNPSTIASKMYLKSNIKHFLSAKTHELSQLMPFIRIYKQYYDPDAELELKFPNFIDPNTDLQSMLDSSLQRGIGVGIESFSWKYIGQNPFTSHKDLEATLIIYAQNFNELLKDRVGVDSAGQTRTYRMIDLVVRQPKEIKTGEDPKDNNPKFYRTKISAGWSTSGYGGTVTSKELDAALKSMVETFDLGLVDHVYDIKDDGSVRLTLTLRPYSETSGFHPSANVMTAPAVRSILEDSEESDILAFAEEQAKEDPDLGEQNAEIVEEIKKSRADKIRQVKVESYKSLLNRLMFPKDQSRRKTNIYCVALGPAEDVEITTRELVNGRLEPVKKTVKIYRPLEARKLGKNATSEQFFLKKSKDDETLVPPEDVMQAGTRNITFFFLGDLLSAAFEAATENDNDLDNVRLVLPTFEYRDLTTGEVKNANLADMPVSVELFSSFMRDKIVNTQQETYPLFTFVREVINDLVFEALGPSCGDGTVATTFDTFQIRGLAEGRDRKDRLLGLRSGTGGRIDLGSFKSDIDGEANLMFPPIEPTVPSEDTYNYVVVYPVNSPNLKIDPKLDDLRRYNNDYEEGRYWLTLGQSDGIVKSATFSKTQVQGLRAIRFTQADMNPEAQLSDVYNVDINLIGNGIFIPGSRIYLNPMGLGSDKLGSPFQGTKPGELRSYAQVMGLGGYHLITGVNSTISNGNFETTINCRHEGWREETFIVADDFVGSDTERTKPASGEEVRNNG